MALDELRQAVHRMHGTSGTYGFPEVAAACRDWEERLKRWLAEARAPDDEMLARVDAHLARLADAVARAAPVTP